MRTIGMAVRLAPGIVSRAGDRHLPLKQFVVRLDVCVIDGPVDTDAILRVDLEVGGMEAGHKRSPVNGASADALAAIVRAQRKRILATCNAQVVPVEVA
jgi:hypothetical protein